MRRLFFIAGVLVSFCAAGALAAAQSAGTSQSSSPNSQQGASASSSSQTKPDSAAKPQPKKPKKVWTNEEIGSLNSAISVVGNLSETAARGKSAHSRTAARSADAERYRRQLAPLRAQLDDLDPQIREVRSMASQGAAYSNTSLDRLEERRQAIQVKMDAIEDDARRHGVAPGDLR